MDHQGALKKLFAELQEQRGLLEDLRESRHAITPRLCPEDRELVKEQVEHLENRWAHLENLIQQTIQTSSAVLKDLEIVESRLREAQEWAREKQPSLSDSVRTSPPPEATQSFLFDHLSVCAELEAKQLLLTQALGGAEELLPRLGLSERRSLQALMKQAQAEVEVLGATVTQRRKHLSKALTERAQFLQALGRTAAWVRRQEEQVLAKEPMALLPAHVSRQVEACRGVLSGLKAQQGELWRLWGQGRELVRDSTDEEKAETLERLQEVQGSFESALCRCSQKLLDLEKALAIRKYFKEDLDKMCDWLKHTEALLFPLMHCNASDTQLHALITKTLNILEQASEYENLLLIVQRAGQDLLPTLNEVDHCYLDEKLNVLPQQYNSTLVWAKQKHQTAQQMMSKRRDFGSSVETAQEMAGKMQEQFEALEKQQASWSEGSIGRLHGDLTDLLRSLGTQDTTLRMLRRRREELVAAGHACNPEALDHALKVQSGITHRAKQKLKQLDQMRASIGEHNTLAAALQAQLKAVKEHLRTLDTEPHTSSTLSLIHGLASGLEAAQGHLHTLSSIHYDHQGHLHTLSAVGPAQGQQQVSRWQEELVGLRERVRDRIISCESLIKDSGNFHTELMHTVAWLKTCRDQLLVSLGFDELTVEKVEQQLRKMRLLEEEVQSKVRIVRALADKERDKQRWLPGNHEGSLKEMMQLEKDILHALTTKQVRDLFGFSLSHAVFSQL